MFWFGFLGIFGLLLLAGGVILSLYAWRNLQSASRLQCPLSRVAKLQPGLRKTRGKIAALGKPLRSPVAKKECVYYRLRVYEEKKKIKSSVSSASDLLPAFAMGGLLGALLAHLYRTHEIDGRDERTTYSRHLLVDKEDNVPLSIEDETGCVEVDLHGATVFTKEKARSASGGDHPPPPHLEELLREEHDLHTVDRRGFFKMLHFVEELLPVGTKATVAGTLEELRSGDLCFQANGGPLVVSAGDVTKEGRSARNRAIGLTIGAASSLGVGLSCLVGAFLLLGRARRARK